MGNRAREAGKFGTVEASRFAHLLRSKIPARLAYVWTDNTPRVVPIWFHWNDHEIVMASPPKIPKLKALVNNKSQGRTHDR